MPDNAFSEPAFKFTDFTGGHTGIRGLHRVEPNMFYAKNMMVYATGLLGPRPGLKAHTVTGVPNGTCVALDYIGYPGRLLALGTATSSSFQVGAVSNDTLTASYTPNIIQVLSAPTQGFHGDNYERVGLAFYDPNGYVYATHAGARTWKVRWYDGADFGSFPIGGIDRGFKGIKLYRDRLFLFSEYPVTTSRLPHRVWFSQPADFTNFPATNYVDLPSYYWEPYAMVHLANHAFFPQRHTGWMAWIGASPASLEVRQTYTDPPALATGTGMAQTSFIQDGDKVWWIRQNGALSVMNGAEYETTAKSYLGFHGEPIPADLTGIRLPDPAETIVFCNRWTRRLLMRHWAVWTMHDFPTTAPLSGFMCRNEYGNRIIFASPGSQSSPPTLMSLDLSLERPALTTDSYARPGDLSDTPLDAEVTFPEYNDPDGTDVLVRQLRIDVVKYASTSGFTATVESAAMWNPDGSTEGWRSETHPVTLTGGTSSGVTDRVILNFADQGWGSAFRIKLSGVYGLAIKSVTGAYDRRHHRLHR
jgi:hypothetical protein